LKKKKKKKDEEADSKLGIFNGNSFYSIT